MAAPETILFDHCQRQRLRRNLAAFSHRSLEPGERRAAVALAVVPDERGEATLILTQRAFHLPRHGGQWALPGGRIEQGESAPEAARRELDEEVGVRLKAEAELGLLDDYATRSGWTVTPVVVWGDSAPRRLVPDPQEVESAHKVGLGELMRPGVKVERRMRGHEGPLLSLRLLGTEIFCPTAAMVYQFVEVGLRGNATRVESFEQPRFTWR